MPIRESYAGLNLNIYKTDSEIVILWPKELWDDPDEQEKLQKFQAKIATMFPLYSIVGKRDDQ